MAVIGQPLISAWNCLRARTHALMTNIAVVRSRLAALAQSLYRIRRSVVGCITWLLIMVSSALMTTACDDALPPGAPGQDAEPAGTTRMSVPVAPTSQVARASSQAEAGRTSTPSTAAPSMASPSTASSPRSATAAQQRAAMATANDDDAGAPAAASMTSPVSATPVAGSAPSMGPTLQLPPRAMARFETLVAPAQLGSSENAVFNSEGRFFVAGGEGIYEITRSASEPPTYTAGLWVPNPAGCLFGGITARGVRLFAPCTNSESFTVDLMVFDPTKSQPIVGRAPIVTKSAAHFNGMAFGPDGGLYLSNSLAVDSPDPAVVRLEIEEEEPLQFTQKAFVAASRSDGPANVGGGSFPNGVRFHGDTMYLVRGGDVAAVPITFDPPDAPLTIVYTAQGTLPTIDDFDIGDDRMWLTQFGAFRVLGLPDDSQMVVTDLHGAKVFAMDLPIIGSSTVWSNMALFGAPCIIVTSFFDGGLYRVTFE